MFHPHFLDRFFGNQHALADTMKLLSAYKVEQDLQRLWREDREEQELKPDQERIQGRLSYSKNAETSSRSDFKS